MNLYRNMFRARWGGVILAVRRLKMVSKKHTQILRFQAYKIERKTKYSGRHTNVSQKSERGREKGLTT